MEKRRYKIYAKETHQKVMTTLPPGSEDAHKTYNELIKYRKCIKNITSSKEFQEYSALEDLGVTPLTLVRPEEGT